MQEAVAVEHIMVVHLALAVLVEVVMLEQEVVLLQTLE
jgi:hypothetical protein